jgi:FixJ family two-component response regulator
MSVTVPIVHVVDDDASFLTAISRMLRANGFSVKTYSSAHEFLSQRDADAPGCVLADLQMSQMSGLDLQSVLAQTPNPLPILSCSNYTSANSKDNSQREFPSQWALTSAHFLMGRRHASLFRW